MRAIVVGGGIGGLTAAVAFLKAGIEPVVLEREHDLRRAQVGGGFTLYSNAMRPLHELGLGPAVEPVGSRVTRAEFRTARGGVLAQCPMRLEEKFGVGTFGVSRTDIHRVLTAALPAGTVRMGAECTGVEQDADGVNVRLADGTEERGDLLIGADGVRSVVRAAITEPTTPRYAGYTVWQGIAETSHPLYPTDRLTLWFGRGVRFVVYSVGGGRPYWAALVNAPQGERDPEGGSKAAALAHYRGWQEPVEDIIETTPLHAISRMDNFGRPPLRRWGSGRVTLLGDAAHPTTINIGQGACLAIEDAFLLARTLTGDKDIPAALRAYEEMRKPRTEALMKLAWRIGWLGQWSNPMAVWVRERIMGALQARVFWPSMEKSMSSIEY